VWPVSRIYNEEQVPLRESLEMALGRVGLCEVAVSLGGLEPGN
jgi:hypothetical protein